MDDKTKQDFILLFNQGFEEVVVPRLEELDETIDKLDKKMDKGFAGVNSKIDNINRRLDTMAFQVGDHEKRIKKLESKSVIA